MDFPRLTVRYIFGRIGIERIPGYFRLKMGTPNMELEYKKDKPFQIDNPAARIEIDQTKPLEDLNLRKFTSLTRYLQGKANRKCTRALTEIVSEGDRLAKIELGGNAIAELARKELDEENREPILTTIPRSAPEIKVKTPKLEVKGGQTRLEVESDYILPKVDYQPDDLKIYLIQKGELQIDVSGRLIDYKV
ncbi:MAG: hypothetical protein PWR10_660 [Halanaerobiales bacterium]|nr:hypothetical protein [Halanaerobiales bacterium]